MAEWDLQMMFWVLLGANWRTLISFFVTATHNLLHQVMRYWESEDRETTIINLGSYSVRPDPREAEEERQELINLIQQKLKATKKNNNT